MYYDSQAVFYFNLSANKITIYTTLVLTPLIFCDFEKQFLSVILWGMIYTNEIDLLLQYW